MNSRENLVGTMRFDFNDGTNTLCNRWFPYKELSQEEIQEIQPKVNEVMFDRFSNMNIIYDTCGGQGYSSTKYIEEETEHFNYMIKLIPVKGDYNGYIFVYRK